MLGAATYLLDNLDSWESFAGSESQPARLYPIPPPLQVHELLAMFPADLLHAGFMLYATSNCSPQWVQGNAIMEQQRASDAAFLP